MLPSILLLSWALLGPAEGPIVEAKGVDADLPLGRVTIVLEPDQEFRTGTRLAVIGGAGPVGWFRLAKQGDGQATFRGPKFSDAQPSGPLRAWVVPPDVVAELLDRWPADAPLTATIDRIGPGARTVWLRAGANRGVEPGDCWWMQIAGQPVARFDVRTVEPDACFCGVVPLASGVSLQSGQTAELWPTPGQRRRGTASTAVAFVDQRGDETIVWVAAARNVPCPAELHLDFYRQGQYLCHGVVEARDDLFWYARCVARAPVMPEKPPPHRDEPRERPAETQAAGSQPHDLKPPAPRTVATPPRAAPAHLSEDVPAPPETPCSVQVGDRAVIRTQDDIDERRFTAHVFELSREGALINAGEGDGLKTGQIATLVRQGRRVGELQVQRVQRGYSFVRFPAGTVSEPARLGDEVHFGPVLAPPVVVGAVAEVVGQTLLTVRVSADARPPLLVPLAVRSANRTIGAAVLLTAAGPRAYGFVLPASTIATIAPGDTLLADQDGRESEDAATSPGD